MQSAWKVGLFVVVFGALLVLAYGLVGESLLERPSDVYYGAFEDAGGIQPGAVVTLAGVEVGTVGAVALEGPKNARMTLHIDKGTFVPADAVLMIPTNLFALGEQRLEIASKAGAAAGRLPVGGTLEGVRASFLASVLPEGEKTIRELNASLRATRELLGDEGLRQRLRKVLETTDKTIASVELLMRDARSVVVENSRILKAALLNASAAVDDLRRGIRSVNAIVEDPSLGRDARTLMQRLNETAAKADELVAGINRLVSDPNLRTSVANTVTNMETVSRTGIEVAENARLITMDGRVVSAKAIELADSAKEIAAEAKKLLEKLSSFVDRLPTGGIPLPKPRFTLESGRNVETDVFQTDGMIEYPLTVGSSVFAGVYDLTEANLLTAQYGQHLGPTTLRYGVFASKVGVGVDWQILPRLSISGDLFDPNDLKFNLRARYLFGDELFGWVGMHGMFHRNEPLFGVGVRR